MGHGSMPKPVIRSGAPYLLRLDRIVYGGSFRSLFWTRHHPERSIPHEEDKKEKSKSFHNGERARGIWEKVPLWTRGMPHTEVGGEQREGEGIDLGDTPGPI